jgi:uncharacterized LabA/DUF88 family protein
MSRVIFYFDGFNFYNGLKAKSQQDGLWKNYYWIDFVKFCQQFIYEHDGHELIAVKYFTAPPVKQTKRSKQSALLNANKIINEDIFKLYQGHYTEKEIVCLADCKKKFKVLEEKCTDVNLALEILSDCNDDKVDIVVLVSADSDQIPTVRAIKENYPSKVVKVYFPPCRNSTDLRSKVGKVVFLENHENKFKNAMMPKVITNNIKTYIKPEDWEYS